jgi:hypothetical protein
MVSTYRPAELKAMTDYEAGIDLSLLNSFKQRAANADERTSALTVTEQFIRDPIEACRLAALPRLTSAYSGLAAPI